MKKSVTLLVLGLLLGLVIGRILPPSPPADWDLVEKGMHFDEVYQSVPSLRHSMRKIKGFDITWSRSGNRYWSFTVYYDEFGHVSEIEKEFYWS